jgi:hypothetical protein
MGSPAIHRTVTTYSIITMKDDKLKTRSSRRWKPDDLAERIVRGGALVDRGRADGQ